MDFGLITKFKTDAADPALTQAALTCLNFSVLQAQVAVVTGIGFDFDPVWSSRCKKRSGTGYGSTFEPSRRLMASSRKGCHDHPSMLTGSVLLTL